MGLIKTSSNKAYSNAGKPIKQFFSLLLFVQKQLFPKLARFGLKSKLAKLIVFTIYANFLKDPHPQHFLYSAYSVPQYNLRMWSSTWWLVQSPWTFAGYVWVSTVKRLFVIAFGLKEDFFDDTKNSSERSSCTDSCCCPLCYLYQMYTEMDSQIRRYGRQAFTRRLAEAIAKTERKMAA